MANLKALKNRIQSVQSTRKITSAMYMVSAAKFRRAQKNWDVAKEYADGLNQILSYLPSDGVLSSESPLVRGKEDGETLIILIASDRGMCGGFNNQLFRHLRQHLKQLATEDYSILPLGKKAIDFIRRYYPSHIKTDAAISHLNELAYTDMQKFLLQIETDFINDCSRCVVFFNQYTSPLQQTPSHQTLLPLVQVIAAAPKAEHIAAIPYFMPLEADFLDLFLRQYVQGILWSVIRQTTVGEYAARMAAMDNATKNCDDMLHGLKLEYNQNRQARITKELIEIISGAEAL